MALNIFIFIVTLSGLVIAGQHEVYSGYSVYGVHIRDFSDQAFIHDLELSLDLDIWQHGSPGIRDARVMVSPDESAKFISSLEERGIKHYMDVPDVAKQLEKEDEDLARWRQSRRGRVVPFDDYPRYDQVNAYIERIAAENPDLVTIVNAGTSFEERDIKYLKISTSNFANASKPIYFLDAMIHAREWVTTPVALYAVHRLVEELREQDRDLLEDIDWIVLPLVNPDGYEYSHTQLHLVGAAMGAAMDALKLEEAGYYAVGNSALLLYATSGSAQDYAQSIGVPFSYTLELPGYGRQFQVPPEYINHINKETWEGIATSARLARTFYNQRLRT